MTEGASYSLDGIEDATIDKPRAADYLYHRIASPDDDFIFVDKSPNFTRQGYVVFMKLDDTRYILKKRTGK